MNTFTTLPNASTAAHSGVAESMSFVGTSYLITTATTVSRRFLTNRPFCIMCASHRLVLLGMKHRPQVFPLLRQRSYGREGKNHYRKWKGGTRCTG